MATQYLHDCVSPDLYRLTYMILCAQLTFVEVSTKFDAWELKAHVLCIVFKATCSNTTSHLQGHVADQHSKAP